MTHGNKDKPKIQNQALHKNHVPHSPLACYSSIAHPPDDTMMLL
jgi:hypothetical protein